MRTPPLLLGAALLFWGWQSELWFFSLAMALILEGSRTTRARWEFSPTDYNRIWNLCTALFFGVVIYLVAAREGGGAMSGLFQSSAGARAEALNKSSRSALLLFQWLPLVFFPFVAAQAYSVRDTVALSTFSWWLRRKQAKQTAPVTGPGVNGSHPYFAVCLLAASATNQRTVWFYAGLSLLLAWAFWPHRSRRFSTILWCGLISLVIGAGFAGQAGLNRLQKMVESMDVPWLSRFSRLEFNPKESRTSIGSIGKLKLSGSIVLRVETSGPPPPALLREVTYNSFKARSWYSPKRDFLSASSETNETSWILLPKKLSRQSVTISHYLPGGRGLLALPHGVSRIDDLPVLLFEYNRMGVVKVSDGPGLVSYRADYDPGASIDGPPEADDLRIPETEAAALAEISSELGLATKTPREAIETVAGFFLDNFSYSTHLRAPTGGSNQTALAEFLLKSRSGHCEYFATATALLLREAKIPTRYAVGYSVQEKSGKKYVVRARHAHAWCLVHLNGAWHDLDTTPASWNATEAARASFWEPLSDLWSRLWFEFSKWRWSQTNLRKYLLWLAVPLVLGLAIQLFFKKQWARSKTAGAVPNPAPVFPGTDSEFYEIERRLLEHGLDRQPGETLAVWVNRVAPAPSLQTLLQLHYRLRFDPAGLGEQERAALKRGVHSWIENEKQPAGPDQSAREK